MRKTLPIALATCALVAFGALGTSITMTPSAHAVGTDTTPTFTSGSALDSHVILQDFSFYQPYDSNTYTTLTQQAAAIKALGVSDIWMAPPYRALDAYNEEGYAVTDRYDLGQFPAGHDGATATKYGTSDQLKTAISALHDQGLHVQADIVPNQIYSYQDREVVPVTAVDQYGNPSDGRVVNKLYEMYSVSGGAGQQEYGTFPTWKSKDLNGISPQDGLGIDRVLLDANGQPYHYSGGAATDSNNYLPDGLGAGEGTALNVNNLDTYLTVDGYFIAGKTATGGDIWRPNLMYYTEHQAGAVNVSYLDYVRANPPVGSGIVTTDTDDEVRTKLVYSTSDSAVSNTTNDYIGSQPGYNSTYSAGYAALRIDKNVDGGNLVVTPKSASDDAATTRSKTADNSDVDKNLLQYEFLLGQDVDNSSPVVQAEQLNWEKFLLDQYGFDGFRWDAAGHYNKEILEQAAALFKSRYGSDQLDHLNYIESYVNEQVGFENGDGNGQLAYDANPYYAYLDTLGSANPSQALSTTFTSSLVDRTSADPGTAIPNWSFVNNHDQEHNVMANIPLTDAQSGGSAYGTKQYQLAQYAIYTADRAKVDKTYAPYNVPAAYAIELTNKDTVPTVYYGDMWEAADSYMSTKSPYYDDIAALLAVRKTNASGAQTVTSYPSNLSATAGQDLVASVRAGTSRGTGIGVVVGDQPGLDTTIQVKMGAAHANQDYVDSLGNETGTLRTDENGVLTVHVAGTQNVQVHGYLAAFVPKKSTTTTVTAGATTIASGASTTLTATIGGASDSAAGTVDFTDGDTLLGTAPVTNGVATLATPATLSVGDHDIVATYSGDAADLGSASSVLALTVSATPVAAGGGATGTAGGTGGGVGGDAVTQASAAGDPAGILAFTGAHLAPIVSIAVLLLLLGAAATFFARRRRLRS